MNHPIVQPFVAMMLLTLLVWLYMYLLRLRFIVRKRIDPQRLATPEQLVAVIPADVNLPANNLRNLFEVPVVFYALCLLLIATGASDGLYVALAWTFVALRGLHSLVQCTSNIVRLRFAAYFLSCLVLWAMVLRVAVLALAAETLR